MGILLCIKNTYFDYLFWAQENNQHELDLD